MAKREPFQVRTPEAAEADPCELWSQAMRDNANGMELDLNGTIKEFIERIGPILRSNGFTDSSRIQIELRHLMLEQLEEWYNMFVDHGYYVREFGTSDDLPPDVEVFDPTKHIGPEDRARWELEKDLRDSRLK